MDAPNHRYGYRRTVSSAEARPLLTRRLRRVDLLTLDIAAAAVLALFCGYAAADPPAPGAGLREPGWLSALVTIAIALPAAVRRRWPLPVYGVAGATSVLALLCGVIPDYAMVAPYAATAFVLYPVALAEPRRRSVPALLAGLVGVAAVGVALASDPEGVLTLTGLGWLVLGATWTFGRAVRERRAHDARSAAQFAQQAVTDERLRIARELHDIVAHSMSLIAVKAAIANHVAPARPEEARDALRVIEATSRGALAEMRRTLGVLRAEAAEPPGRTPVPGLADLPELVTRAAAAGVEVELVTRGAAGLPEGEALSVYRIVQEALTNVVKHAGPTRCRVVVEVERADVRVEVADEGPRDRRRTVARRGTPRRATA